MNDPTRSATQTLVSALAVGAIFGVLSGLGLGLATGQLNGWDLGRDTWVVAATITALYVLIFGAGFLVLAGVALALGRRPGARLFVAVGLAGALLLNGALRYNLAVQFVSVVPHMTWLGVFNLCTLALAAGVLLWSLLGSSAARIGGGVAAAAVAVLVVHVVNVRHELPLRRDITRAVPEALAAAPLPPEPSVPASERFSETRLMVLGFDGLSFEVLLPLLRDGELPHFRRYLADAAYGYLETHAKPTSPVVWEEISTGRPPREHGIGYHVHFEFPGVIDRIRLLPQFYRGKSPMALRQVITRLAPYAPWDRVPSDSTDAKAARFYDIAAARGHSVGSFDWMNTGPVYPIRGWLRGYGPVPPRFYPETLNDGLPPVPELTPGIHAGSVDYVRERDAYERVLYERFWRMALSHPTELLLFYTHFHDAVNHLNWKVEAHGEGFFFSSAEHPDFEPGEATRIGMRYLDDVLGDVMARLPDDAILVIVSDHGFDFRGFEHDNGPPGVLFARGPGIRPGPFPPAYIADVAPTLLHWLGLPVAEDMKGQVVELAESGGPLDRRVERVASYGGIGPAHERRVSDPEALREHEEYLRALGYVN